MPPDTLLLIRHAEKPSDDGLVRGVDAFGREDPDSLSVRGWQRAGALVRLFSPHDSSAAAPGLPVPQSLWAPRPVPPTPSQRSRETLMPLAESLSLPIQTQFARGDEAAVAQALLNLSGVVLVAWAHEGIPSIARGLGPVDATFPLAWPKDRFDLVWVFTPQQGARWSLRQVPQRLLAGDSDRPA